MARKLLGAVLLALLGATAANAGSGGPGFFWPPPPPPPFHRFPGSPVAAPEIDPAAAIGALTLLAGGLAIVRGRRSRR